MHNNGIADMVSFSSFTKTGIEVLNLLVLEKLEGERQGSFAVYSVRWSQYYSYKIITYPIDMNDKRLDDIVQEMFKKYDENKNGTLDVK